MIFCCTEYFNDVCIFDIMSKNKCVEYMGCKDIENLQNTDFEVSRRVRALKLALVRE